MAHADSTKTNRRQYSFSVGDECEAEEKKEDCRRFYWSELSATAQDADYQHRSITLNLQRKNSGFKTWTIEKKNGAKQQARVRKRTMPILHPTTTTSSSASVSLACQKKRGTADRLHFRSLHQRLLQAQVRPLYHEHHRQEERSLSIEVTSQAISGVTKAGRLLPTIPSAATKLWAVEKKRLNPEKQNAKMRKDSPDHVPNKAASVATTISEQSPSIGQL